MDDQLTPRERAMFAALPRQRVGSAALEDRVVQSLVRRGLLHRVTMVFGRSSWRVLAQLSAAAAAVFAIGAAVGRPGQAADVPVQVAGQDRQVVDGLAGASGASSPFETTLPSPDSLQRLAALAVPMLGRMGSATVGAIVMLPSDTVEALSRIVGDVARLSFGGLALQLARTHRDTVMAVLRVSSRLVALPEPVAR